MSMLEVPQNCPSQRKVLLTVIGGISSMDARLIEFDLDKTRVFPIPWI